MYQRWNQIVAAIRSELQPYPGRAAGTLRDTLAILLAMIAAMVLQLPGISLALALVLLLQRESAGVTLRNALEIAGGAALALAAVLLWVQATDGTEVMRFLGVALLVFTAGFGMAASRFPLVCTMFGFYGFVYLSAWDTHRSANAIVTTSLYQLGALCLTLGMAVTVNFFFANRHPMETLHAEMHRRLQLLHDVFHSLASGSPHHSAFSQQHHRLLQLAAAGERPLYELYEEARSGGAALEPGLHFRIGLLAHALRTASVLHFGERDAISAAVLAAQCESLLEGSPASQTLPSHTSQAVRSLHEVLREYATGGDDLPVAATPPPSAASTRELLFFHPASLRDPSTVHYALKLTFSAMVCYILYSAVAWPGILTCVVTVLFTGLSSTGAMKQKQIFRLSGACIGGAIALVAESLFFPNMDSITSLVVLAGAVALISAWVARSPSMSYIGVQIAFAFFLTAMNGFSASTTIAPARDRVIGVALGIAVMWVIFDQLWPVRPSQLLHQIHRQIAASRDMVLTSALPETATALRRDVASRLAAMQTLTQATAFDFGHGHHRELARTRRLRREIETAAAEFYVGLHALEAGIPAAGRSARQEIFPI